MNDYEVTYEEPPRPARKPRKRLVYPCPACGQLTSRALCKRCYEKRRSLRLRRLTRPVVIVVGIEQILKGGRT